ncbi:hypothetical protein COCNU_08G006250 [Cocos nucifera]|uniref:Uncharacterized protein n=1 Tax=Cocos nucifera TaxID=13894 RepID=A0A8K0IHU5_COCNU|nr:hypothetical protein COCNU_08G006250 [Cocos nucifera]
MTNPSPEALSWLPNSQSPVEPLQQYFSMLLSPFASSESRSQTRRLTDLSSPAPYSISSSTCNMLFAFQTNIACRHQTFQLIKPSHSQIFTADSTKIEHILDFSFPKYSKVLDSTIVSYSVPLS